MPVLDRITVFPVKSFDGLEVPKAFLHRGGGIAYDRRWQFVDSDGRVVHAKRQAVVQVIRASFDISGLLPGGPASCRHGDSFVTLRIDPLAVGRGTLPGIERLRGLQETTFPLVPGSSGPCGWLAEAVGFEVFLRERPSGGFPDDLDAPGPTLITSATINMVANWFGLNAFEVRRRFRTNLEIGSCDAFWEDTLIQRTRLEKTVELPVDPGIAQEASTGAFPAAEFQSFQIGPTRLLATNVCRRCVVPSRDSRTAQVTTNFRAAFEAHRNRSMRSDVDTSAWSHSYRLAVNTAVVLQGIIAVGQEVIP